MKTKFNIILTSLAFLFGVVAFAQQTVTGTVTDESGVPMPGATVQNNDDFTTTDFDGNFSIDANIGDNLTISFVGYNTANVSVDSATLSITLTSSTNLDEVIVTGVAGATDIKKASFAVGKINAETIQKAPGINPGTAIRSKVSGVTVVQGSGLPGSAPAIRIRGASSLSGSQSPLIIVDGVVLNGSLSDINSEDIENVEVLKGSAAASLYGARGANGVINIFTKRGATKEGVEVRFRAELGTSYLRKKPSVAQYHNYQLDSNGDFLLDSAGGLILEADGIIDNPFPVYYNSIDAFYNSNDYSTQYVSVASRSKNSNTLLSFQNTQQDGVLSIDFFGYERQNFRFNHDVRISDKLSLSFSSLLSNSSDTEPGSLGSGSPFYSLLFTPPHADLMANNEEDGSPYDWDAQINTGWPTTETNPLYALANENYQDERTRILANINSKYKIDDDFTLGASYSRDIRLTQYESFVDKDWLDTENTTNQNGYIERNQYKNDFMNGNVSLSMNKDVNDDLNIKGQISYDYQETTGKGFYASGSKVGILGINDLNNVVADEESISSSRYDIVETSAKGILAFDYKDKYLIDVAFSRDGSSLYGEDIRNQNFYRVSGAWRVSEDLKINNIDEFKVRASIGTAGLRPGFGSIYETYSLSQGTAQKNVLGNSKLGPFVSEEMEIGTNISFLDRFDFEYNYSEKTTTGQVLPVDIPVEIGGFATQYQNAGSLVAKTHEFAIGAEIMKTDDISWDAKAFLFTVEQEITELFRPAYQTGPNSAFLIEAGKPFGMFYGYQVLTSLSDLPSSANASDYSINDDGYVVDSAGLPQFLLDENGAQKQVQIGDVNPDFQASFNSTFNYKNLSFFMLWDIKQGGSVYNNTRQWTYRELLHPDVVQVGAANPKPADYYSALYNVNTTTSHFVEDASFIKLREVALSYDLDIDNLYGIDDVKISLIGRDLLTISDYTGLDPEVTSSGDLTNFMFDGFGYPTFATITGSIEIKF